MNKELGLYYIDLDKSLGEDFSEYKFNDQGIPKARRSDVSETLYGPVTICQYALYNFNQFIRTGNIEAKQKFLIQANWLCENFNVGPNNSVVWYYQYDIPFYKLRKPWISGMAQGEALSVLLRAFQITKDEAYFNLANKAWNIFSVSVENGGVITTYPDGAKIIEEYPTLPGSCVLNGFIFALFGVYDFWILTQDQQYRHLFEDCIESLKKNLKRYDTSYWTLYDLWKPLRLTARFYHRLHIVLLKVLFDITKEKFFLDTSERWISYLKNPLCNIKWGMKKIKQRIAL